MAEEKQDLQEIVEKLKESGIDPNALFALVTPLVENAATKVISGMNLPKLIDVAVDRSVGPLVEQVKALGEKMGQGQQGQTGGKEAAAVGGGGGLSGILNNPNVQTAVVNKLLGGSPDGSLDAMTKMAKSYGDAIKMFMEPLVSIQSTMRQSVLAEMQTYSKTGGTLPWDREVEPAKPVANLSRSDEAALIEGVAKRIKFV